MTESVSVVVPTFNDSHHLARLFYSLDELQGEKPMEVIVVDDGSTDSTHEMVEKWLKDSHDFSARCFRNNSNSGPAKARNLGTMKAKGDYVAYIDSDCVADKKWLAELTRFMDVDDGIVGVGGRVLPVANDMLSKFYSFHRILEPPESLLYLVTANCCYHRRSVLEVQGFDEDIRKAGGEDVALSIKLLKKGLVFTYSPEAIVYHDFKNSIKDFYMRHLRYGEGCRIVSTKYLGGSR